MQSIQIDGTYTYADNIKELKLGDQVKLISNPNNRMNKEAVGAYTQSGKKIGYVPFKSNQIDLKAKYIVSKIQLTQANPILLISMDWPNTNSVHCEPACVTMKKLSNPNDNIVIPDSLAQDLKKFAKSLEKSGYNIKKIGVCELSDSYITLCFQTPNSTHYFYTVTKSFYEQNIFKYDEFYKFGLTPKCIYIPFQTHRLEKYLEFSYKPSLKLFSGKKYSWDNLTQLNVWSGLDPIDLSGPNCSMGLVQLDDLILFNAKLIPKQVSKSDWLDWIKLTIQYNTSPIEHYNPNNLIPGSAMQLDLTKLKAMFDNLEPGGLAYNHKLQAYCPIDLVDPINIVEITLEKTIGQKFFIELVGKVIVSNKQIINVLNPIDGLLFRLEVSDKIKSNFSNIISKPN